MTLAVFTDPALTFANALRLLKLTLGARSVVTREWKLVTGDTVVCRSLSVATTIMLTSLSVPGIW